MKVLVIGSGGREHCIAWKISKSDFVEKIYAIPGNPGIAELAECKNIDIKKEIFSQIISFVEEKGIVFYYWDNPYALLFSSKSVCRREQF